MLARRAVGRGGIARVAAPAHPAFEQNHALAHFGKVREKLLALFVEDLGADRDFDHQVRGAGARAVLAHAMTSALGAEVLGVAEIDQRIEAGHRDHDDIAALAAVASIRPAVFDVLFASEADRAGPARAGLEVNLGLVEKMHAFI